MVNQQQAAQDLKHDYMSRIMEALTPAAPIIGGGVSGIGSAVIADKLINTDEDHAKDMINITSNAYRQNSELGQTAAYIYGDTRTMAPIAQKMVGEVLSGEDPKGFRANFLKTDHPDVYARITNVMAARPDLAQQLGIHERLVTAATIKAISGNPETGIQMMNDSEGSNSLIPMAAGLAAGAGGALAGTSFAIRKRS